MIYGEGISREGSLLDMAVARRIIVKSGAWFSYGDMRMAQGRDNARLFLKDNPELAAEIDAKVRAELEAERAKAQAEAEARRQSRQASLGDAPTPGV